ncbi:class I SAM-dependent methyltransferase [Glaciimonas sp. PAMC28666]|uniref:class I SAM-dependent methyltransferase n=1 Tax=Glaciimonas sp. PAMC28666 TaxID=2807626 RepID=UPI001962CAE8|nr:SAM-dependent methyltransferase [Glaciimonas sp. PAMC28666]QRX84436.1 SAM-dependent methyltransferase [Glaciimonas sp. PAMC28666]
MQLQLPEASIEAQQASSLLHRLIAAEICHNDGWISFARYMELVLYAPDLGYYSGGAAKLGKDGDFTTAPEITPLFGATLAQLSTELITATDAPLASQILEFGAGTGQLAWDILTELQSSGFYIETYYIVELSAELRARQERKLKGFPQVQWLDRLPTSFSGVVIGNEVLDAMPIELVVRGEHGWLQRGVGLKNAPQSDVAADSGQNNEEPQFEQFGHLKEFVYVDRPAQPALITQIPDAADLAIGYLTEVHPVAIGFMHSLAAMLSAGSGGAALLIDYGFPASEYYLGQRDQGTLMCHYRHHAHPDPFYWPGLQDVTAHVDFTAMAVAAIHGGLDVMGYTCQAAFLLDAGIAELLLRTSPEEPLKYLPQANAVQKLISPAEMGELFKVLIVGKQALLPSRFERNDRCHKL